MQPSEFFSDYFSKIYPLLNTQVPFFIFIFYFFIPAPTTQKTAEWAQNIAHETRRLRTNVF